MYKQLYTKPQSSVILGKDTMMLAGKRYLACVSYSILNSTCNCFIGIPTLGHKFFLCKIDLIDEYHIPANRLQKPEPYVFEPEKITVLKSRYLILQEWHRATLKPQGRIAYKIPLNWIFPLYNHKPAGEEPLPVHCYCWQKPTHSLLPEVYK